MSSSETNPQKRFFELAYHSFWRRQPSPAVYRSECGKNISVEFCGRYNRAAGPDFLGARVVIDSELHIGDIEIHVDQQDWLRHKHETNPAYDRVVLHVFVSPSGKPSRTSEGREIPAVRLSPEMLTGVDIVNPRSSLKNIEGACGLLVGSHNERQFRKILSQAAETRLLHKAGVFRELLDELPEEELLYRYLFRAFGLKKHGAPFLKCAESFTLQDFERVLATKTPPDAVRHILDSWYEGYIQAMRNAGLEVPAFAEPPDFSAEEAPKLKYTATIYNNVRRGMALMLQHMWAMRAKGPVRSWADKLVEINRMPMERLKASSAIEVVRPLFEPPAEAFFPSPGKGIGTQKIIIVMANAVLPFFVAWAEKHNRKDLLNALFSLFCVLPGEKPNHKVGFMLNRLGWKEGGFNTNGGMQLVQGLIQLHDDCCHHFHDGCTGCVLASRLSALSPSN